MIAGMIIGDVVGEKMASLGVVAGLGIGDGVVFLWMDLVVVVVILQKAKEREKVLVEFLEFVVV